MIITYSDPDLSTIANRIKTGFYDLQPDFQRDITWNTEKQQKLIDSIMRGWHIPPIHLVRVEGKFTTEKFEVLDGKQRLNSIFQFYNDKISFNGHFLPETGNLYFLHNLKFSNFPQDMKNRFETTSLRVFYLSGVEKDEATELFLRLNQGVAVSISEKRNCIYGVVKENLREILGHYSVLFNETTLGFENRRMAYQDALDRIYYLEKCESLDYKPNSRALERMYFEETVDPFVIMRLNDTLEATQKILGCLFINYHYKLTKSTLISYYWFIRQLSKNNDLDIENVRKFIIEFEKWRDELKNTYEQNLIIDKNFIEFNTYLSKGWLDPASLNGRHRILMEMYQNFRTTFRVGVMK
jgi:hypothetical protein